MNLRVCFHNPLADRPPYVEFENVIAWNTDRGELQISRTHSGFPDVVFAPRQWVWVEVLRDEQTIQQPVASPKPTRPNGQAAIRRKSDLSDLAIPTAYDIERTKAASVEFAIDNRTVPWSEAHMRKLIEYEAEVRAEFGEEGVMQLPWNKVPRASDNR